MSLSYLTVAETTALLAEELATTDERRTAWDSLSGADKAVAARQATRDIDAVAWRGRVDSADQELAWPRREFGSLILPGGEMAAPGGASAWSVPSVPGAIRRAAAVQAARNAARARGFDRARQAADLAHVGVSGRSGGGSGASVDLGRANLAAANLDPDAARIASDLMLGSAEVV